MNIGTVKWFSLKKGYGFIHPDDGSPNIVVYMSAIESAGMSGLKEGQRVSFEIGRDARTGLASAVSLKTLATAAPLDDHAATEFVRRHFRVHRIDHVAAPAAPTIGARGFRSKAAGRLSPAQVAH